MIEALEKIKAGLDIVIIFLFNLFISISCFVSFYLFLFVNLSELMLLGFISLLLTVGTSYVAKICIPERFGNKWLPCDSGDYDGDGDEKEKNSRKLISYGEEMVWRRALAAGNDQYDYCRSKVRD